MYFGFPLFKSPHEGQVNCLCASEDGKIVISGGADSIVAVHRYDHDNGSSSSWKGMAFSIYIAGCLTMMAAISADLPCRRSVSVGMEQLSLVAPSPDRTGVLHQD